MKRTTPYFIAVCLLLVGCTTYGPWIKTDFEGPWCGTGERTEIWKREYSISVKPGLRIEAQMRHHSIRRPINIYKLVGDDFKQTRFWQLWPTINRKTGIDRFTADKKPPFKLYLVSISPTVIVGVSKEGDLFREPKVENSYYHPLKGYCAGLASEHVWIMTQLSASPDARLVYFAPELGMELEVLNLGSGSTALNLQDGSQLTISREKANINIVRESKSPKR
jgi:hypothetical protein